MWESIMQVILLSSHLQLYGGIRYTVIQTEKIIQS